MYLKRLLDLDSVLEKKSCFLFGARQLGKSTYIKNQLTIPIAKTYNLLDHGMLLKLSTDPSRMRQEIEVEDIYDSVVVIDEIQKCPQLLDEVQLLIEERKIRFLLTGSSARKLKKAGTNLLGGRARNRNFHPLTYIELKDYGFDLEKAMQYGLIPSHYLSDAPDEDLQSYVGRYLTEEISAEGLSRNIPAFSRFLEVAATCNGQLINYSNIASDAKVNRSTVQNYFEILKDTLLAFELSAYTKTIKRKAIETSKFYFLDMGIVNHLRQIGKIQKGSNDFGEFFEHFIFCEIRAYLDYFHPLKKLAYWRSTSGFEVDFFIDEKIAIEVKSTNNVTNKHLKGLFALREEGIAKNFIIVSDEKEKRICEGILIYPWRAFLNELWSGKIT